MIVKLTAPDNTLKEEKGETFFVNTDQVQYFKRSRDCTLVFVTHLQTPLTVQETPAEIEKLFKGKGGRK